MFDRINQHYVAQTVTHTVNTTQSTQSIQQQSLHQVEFCTHCRQFINTLTEINSHPSDSLLAALT